MAEFLVAAYVIALWCGGTAWVCWEIARYIRDGPQH
jgi:hypothetical protein